jgi:hypothetical protein
MSVKVSFFLKLNAIFQLDFSCYSFFWPGQKKLPCCFTSFKCRLLRPFWCHKRSQAFQFFVDFLGKNSFFSFVLKNILFPTFCDTKKLIFIHSEPLAVWRFIHTHSTPLPPGLPDFPWYNIPKRGKKPNYHKMYQMALKYINGCKIFQHLP